MQRDGEWSLADFDLSKEIYRGKASVLYKASVSLLRINHLAQASDILSLVIPHK